MAGGRPTKFTSERCDKIIELIRAGNFKTTAARRAGVHPDTLNEWIRRGKAATKGKYFEFSAALEAAEAEAEIKAVAKINDKMDDSSIQAILEWLRRRFPELWNTPDKRETAVTFEDKNVEVIDLRLENLLARYRPNNTGRRKVSKNGGGESVDTDNTAR
jgi:hypothetical protein